MRKLILLPSFLCYTLFAFSQKRPLDHSVYDGWQSITERYISNNGQYVAYTITPQEGDGMLVIQAVDNSYKKEIPRGYNATITEDNRFVIFKFRPWFKESREARIKKKKPDDIPKDTLGIIELGKDSILKIPRVRTYRLPERGNGWMAYLMEKPLNEALKARPDSLSQVNNLLRMADSLVRVADSIRNRANEVKTKGLTVLQADKKESKPPVKAPEDAEEGTDLVLRHLATGQEIRYRLVTNYVFSKNGRVLVLVTTRKNSDTLVRPSVLWIDLGNEKDAVQNSNMTGNAAVVSILPKTDTIMRRFNEIRNITIDSLGTQVAFVAERDSATKALQKFFKLWYYRPGMDSAFLQAERNTKGIAHGFTVSESQEPVFSRDGKQLFFGLAPVRRPKDTTLVDFETARLDIWHYNDDYLQPQQLVQLVSELRRSYLAVTQPGANSVVQLGSDSAETVVIANEGNAGHVLATTTRGNRLTAQWEGFTRQSAYIISTADGTRKTVKEKVRTIFTISPGGKYVIWYDPAFKSYFTYQVDNGATRNISQKITTPLYDDEDDHPDDPPPFDIAGWTENDESVLLHDRYDIWQTDPAGMKAPVNVTNGYGKKNRIVLRWVKAVRDFRYIKKDEDLLLDAFSRTTKYDGFFSKKLNTPGDPVQLVMGPYTFGTPLKAAGVASYMVNRMSPQESPNVYVTGDFKQYTKLSSTNPQQKDYNWLTSELVKWKMPDGREAEGLLFKPENFDPAKKYPVIFYFYEKDADGLFLYRQPAPSASTINIPYFVSNGYLVFDPNIYYRNGEPGQSAYNSVVSAAKYLSRMPWVDTTRLALQGQSWGGYQVAYLVTHTHLFAAAGAGAPVANMTSAYGGIRWGTGLSRQFQYERSQTRIGATLWQRPDLFIKNSPLFRADKVTTPLLITHNDADGAVPWTQGIEFFTALRRLGKKVWMLQYNGEDHNLVERRNRKDLSIRLGQFFDHYLKGAPAAKWIREGVPATLKGIDWGTTVEEGKAAF